MAGNNRTATDVMINRAFMSLPIKSLLIALCIACCTMSCKQKEKCAVTESAATFYVADIKHDFGEKLKAGKDYTYDFVFFNTGKTPLIINDVKTSCHCTTAEFPKQPVMPGESAEIHVTLNEDSKGFFRRSITVYNNSAKRQNLLWVTGKVE